MAGGELVRRRFGRLYVLALALYSLFLVTAQFEHHDLLCHLKTPQHCTSCASSQLGSDLQKPAGLEHCRLLEAGRATASTRQLHGVILVAPASGRDPPAYS